MATKYHKKGDIIGSAATSKRGEIILSLPGIFHERNACHMTRMGRERKRRRKREQERERERKRREMKQFADK